MGWLWLLLNRLDIYRDWDDRGQLLFGEKVFPVLILTLELLIGALNGSLLLLQLADLLLEDLHLLTFLHSAPDSAFSVLEAPSDTKGKD